MCAHTKIPDKLPNAPVFAGFDCFGFSQSIIAQLVGVPQPLISHWYRGERSMEAGYILLLTSALALVIDAAGEGEDTAELSTTTKRILATRREVAQQWLSLQQELNEQLPAEAHAHALALEERLVESRRAALKPRPSIRRRKAKDPTQHVGRV